MKIAVDAEDARSLVRFTMKGKFGPKLQELGFS